MIKECRFNFCYHRHPFAAPAPRNRIRKGFGLSFNKPLSRPRATEVFTSKKYLKHTDSGYVSHYSFVYFISLLKPGYMRCLAGQDNRRQFSHRMFKNRFWNETFAKQLTLAQGQRFLFLREDTFFYEPYSQTLPFSEKFWFPPHQNVKFCGLLSFFN